MPKIEITCQWDIKLSTDVWGPLFPSAFSFWGPNLLPPRIPIRDRGRESRGERENARRQRKKFHCYGHRRENVREKAEEGAKDGPTTVKGTRLRKENGRIRIYNLTTVILLKYSLHQVIRMFSILEQLQSAWGLGHLKVFLTYSTPRLCVQGTLAGLL